MSQKFFTQGQVISFLEKAFGDGKPSNGGKNFSVVCPMCKAVKGEQYSKQKLVIRTDAFLSHCWVCGYKSRNIYNLLKKWVPEHLEEYENTFLDAEEIKISENENRELLKPIALPEGFKLLAEVSSRFSIFSVNQKRYYEQAFSYLKKRGICTKTELWYWKFGVTQFYKEGCKDRVIIPSFDSDGNLSYWTGRSWRKRSTKKYNNPACNRKNIIFNELNIDWSEPLTIVEGPFDLIKCNQNATCVLGSDLTLEFKLMQKILQNKTPVVLAFDPEKEAQANQFVLAERFFEFDVPVKIVEYKIKERDIGEMTKTEFIDLLNSAKTYSRNYQLKRKIASILQ